MGSNGKIELLKGVLNLLPNPVYIKNSDHVWIEVNEAFCRFVGYSREELIGRTDRHYFPQSQADIFWERDDRVLNTRTSNVTTEQHTNASGDVRWMEVSKSCFEDASGNAFIVGILTDVTEQKSREKALEEARQTALIASKSKTEFLANMSHEIRTPMNGVLGMTELLLDTDLQPQQRQYVDVIASSGKALLNIINDILDYSKIAAGKMELEQIDFDLDQLCLECASVFSVTAERKGLELVCSLQPGTPTFIQADPTRLRQVLLNLLGNAFKFTNEGYISLRVQEIRGADWIGEGEHLLRFEIRDTGIGIEESAQEGLFRAFSQADASTSRQYGGTGLGLTISQQLVQLMGGEIGVMSAPREGSTFWFTIRCGNAGDMFVQDHMVPLSALKGRKLLIVDDSPEFTQVVQEQATAWGMRAKVAYYGEQALTLMADAAAQGDPFDIVTLDMNMPGMNGLECAHAMQANPALRSSLCILLTAVRQIPDREALQQANVRLAIQKPASARVLRETMLGLLDLQANDLTTRVRNNSQELLRNTRVLVVEDNSVNQMVIKGMLKKLGVIGEIAANGKIALALLTAEHSRYDLVLMDCEMPVMDGYSATIALRQLEQEKQLPPLPVIALTAHVMPEHQRKALASGMNDYMAKPLEFNTLKEKLLSFLTQPSSQITLNANNG